MDKKYTSLEHSIRNIMTESVGAIGTDKFTKTGNSFFRSFHVEPKKGDTHPNGNAIRATRNVQNERGSPTMNSVTEEEQLDEFLRPKEGGKGILTPAFDYLDRLLKPKKTPTDLAPPTEAPTVPAPKTEPIKPKTDEPEVAPKPQEAPAVTPKKVEEPVPTSKPDAKIKPDDGTVPKSGTDAKPATGEAPKPKGDSPSKPPKAEEPKPKPKVGGAFPISFPLAVNPLLGAYGGTNVRTFMHSPQEYMESTEADKIRQSIENVARPGGKNRITKQGEIKAKIIEDNNKKANIVRDAIKEKKAGKNPLVDTKPKLNDLELDEKYVGGRAGGSGAPPPPKPPKPPAGSGDSFLTKTKNYLTNPQTYKNLGAQAAQIGGGTAVGAIAGYLSGPALTQKVDKSTGGFIDKTIENSGLSSVMPSGKRNAQTGAFEPDDPKYKYGHYAVADLYKDLRANLRTGASNLGAKVGLSKGTTYDVERKKEEEAYPTPKEFSITNPGSWDVDSTADVLQMIPQKHAQIAGLGIAATRSALRRDPVNFAADTLQYGPYSRLARKVVDRGTKFSEPLKSRKADTIVPSLLGGYQIGTAVGKE